MKFSYYAIFEPENTGFWLYFPELTGCHTCGYDFEHAKKMAKEALDLYLHNTDILELPKQSSLKSIRLSKGQKIVWINTDLSIKEGKVYCADVKMIQSGDGTMIDNLDRGRFSVLPDDGSIIDKK